MAAEVNAITADAGVTQVERALRVRFRDRALRRTALTHRSYAFEQGGLETNERLEFLGDAVLGVIVTDLAFREFPTLSEGSLAKLRAAVVNMGTLAAVASEIGLGEEILLGRGEELSGGRAKASILADSLEAVLGALYVDRGQRVVTRIVEERFWPRMEAYVRGEGDRDYKTVLQERAAQDVRRAPEYRVVERGPDHMKEFTATVYVAGQALGVGTGRSKKEAEQQAAREAFARMTGSANETPAPDRA